MTILRIAFLLAVSTIPFDSLPTGSPAIAVIANGFTYGPGVSPGSFIVITGTNLASQTMSFTGARLPTSLADTYVLLDGRAIPLYFVSPTQINAQIPIEAPVSLSTLQVINGTDMSEGESVPIFEASPGIANYVLNFGNHAVATNGDNSINSPSNPAPAGSLITIYLTGIGPVTNPVEAGVFAPASPLSNAQLQVTVNVDGQIYLPSFAGLSPGSVGLAQVNVQIPTLVPGDIPVTISAGDAASNTVLISVTR